MRHIGRCVLLALIGWGLLPAHATARVSYEEAVRGYYAMLQIQRDVWLDNPNQLEAARHALIIARDHGLIGGNPSAIELQIRSPDTGHDERQRPDDVPRVVLSGRGGRGGRAWQRASGDLVWRNERLLPGGRNVHPVSTRPHGEMLVRWTP